MLQICLEEDLCLYRPNAQTLQGSQMENCRD